MQVACIQNLLNICYQKEAEQGLVFFLSDAEKPDYT